MREFIDYLHSHGGRDLSAEEIADILWLASHLPEPEEDSAPTDDAPIAFTIAQTIVSRLKQVWDFLRRLALGSSDSEPRDETKPQGAGRPPALQHSSNQNRTEAYLPGSQSVEDGLGVASLPFRSPAPSALPQRLALGRALRSLKRTAPSPTRFVLDEAATVQRIADEGNWLPVLRPARERWLELALVADESPSMTVWYELIGELQALLEQSSAFRTVQRWGLYADPTQPSVVRFYAGSRFWDGGSSHRRPGELNDPRGRRLILLVSDCVSAIWRQPGLNELLADWKDTPTTLVQVLPERLWGRTGLRFGREAILRSPKPGLPNPSLLALPRRALDGAHLPAGFSLPVVTLEPETLALWSQGLTAKGSAWMLGRLFPEKVSTESVAPPSTGERPAPDAQRLFDQLRRTGSEEAVLLARYLSALPLSLPVMRLTQQVMFAEPRQSQLAEVLLSGLVQRKPDQPRDTHPDQVEYDFIDGARDLLRRAAGERELLIVLSRTSAFVDANSGLPVDFPTLLADPSRAGSLRMDEKSLPFASIAADTLRRIGGSHTLLADFMSAQTSGGVPDPIPVSTTALPAESEIGSIESVETPVQEDVEDSVVETSSPPSFEETDGLPGAGVRVGILSTGIDASHPDFEGRIAAVRDFTGTGEEDRNGYGSQIAGIVAGNGRASNGQYRGLAPGCELFIAKVLNDVGQGDSATAISGVTWLIENQLDILLCPLGVGESSDGNDPLSKLLDVLVENGTVVVVAAGNRGSIGSPAAARRVLTVGVATSDGAVQIFSGRGPTRDGRTKPDLVAPADEIVTVRSLISNEAPLPENTNYTVENGTGAAAAYVAGVVAFLLGKNPSLKPDVIANILRATAKDLGDDPNVQGAGLLDLEALLALDVTDESNIERITHIEIRKNEKPAQTLRGGGAERGGRGASSGLLDAVSAAPVQSGDPLLDTGESVPYHIKADFPSSISSRDESMHPLLVQLVINRPAESQTDEIMPVEFVDENTPELVELHLTAPAFTETTGVLHRTLVIWKGNDSEPTLFPFKLSDLSSGDKELRLDFYHLGYPIGSTTFRTEVTLFNIRESGTDAPGGRRPVIRPSSRPPLKGRPGTQVSESEPEPPSAVENIGTARLLEGIDGLRFVKPGTEVPDVILRVVQDEDRKTLHFRLSSPQGKIGYREKEMGRVIIQRLADPTLLLADYFSELNRMAQASIDSLDEVQARDHLERTISLGNAIYEQLFPAELKEEYWRLIRLRDEGKIRSLLILSDEPWIPWEILYPYKDEVGRGDFLAAAWYLTRWQAGLGLNPELTIQAIQFIAPTLDLNFVHEEKEYFESLAKEYPQVTVAEMLTNRDRFLDTIRSGSIQLLHFATHASFVAEDADSSPIHLSQGETISPIDLSGPATAGIRRERPLVFLNASHGSRREYTLTGLGGWAERMIRQVGATAFVAPYWEVNDRLATLFARSFYDALRSGYTLGEATYTARQTVRQVAPANPTWLAYTVYGDPNCRITFGAPD